MVPLNIFQRLFFLLCWAAGPLCPSGCVLEIIKVIKRQHLSRKVAISCRDTKLLSSPLFFDSTNNILSQYFRYLSVPSSIQ